MKIFWKMFKMSKKFEFASYRDVDDAIDRIMKYHISECPNCKENKDSK